MVFWRRKRGGRGIDYSCTVELLNVSRTTPIMLVRYAREALEGTNEHPRSFTAILIKFNQWWDTVKIPISRKGFGDQETPLQKEYL